MFNSIKLQLFYIFLTLLACTVDSSRNGTTIAIYIHAIASRLGVEIVQEYLESMKEVELYYTADYIYLTILGNKSMFTPTLSEHPKVSVLYHSKLLNRYEFPSMHYISKHSKEKYDANTRILYVHTKGVNYELQLTKEHQSSVSHPVNAWRKMLSYYLINKWKYCMNVMDAGYKAVGVGLLTVKYPVHFSGNFWWVSSSIIKPIPTLDIPQKQKVKMESRYECEKWALQWYNSPEQRPKITKEIYCLFRYEFFYYHSETVHLDEKEYKNELQFQSIRNNGTCPNQHDSDEWK